MLAPDLTRTQASLQANADAASAATNYAQAAVTAVPRVADPPDWFAPIQADLTTAQAHAQNWITSICPAVTTGVPQGVIDFNATFQTQSGQILQIQQDIDGAGGQPTAAQRSSVNSLLQALTGAFAGQAANISTLQGDIIGYAANIKSDQDALQVDLGTVSNRFTNGGTWIQQLTAAIGDNFLNSTVLGPCTSIVEIDINISLKVGGVQSDPTLITLIFAKAVLENQIANSEASQQAVQAILDTWTTLKVKAEAVINDLKDAQDSAYLAILSQIDLQTAQTQWQQLSDFAAGLLQTQSTPPDQ